MQGIAAFPPGPRPPRTFESRTDQGTIGCTVVAISKTETLTAWQAELLMRYLSRFWMRCDVLRCFSEAPLAGGRSLRGPVMDCRSAPSESPLVGTEYVHMLRDTELAKMAVSKVIPISY